MRVGGGRRRQLLPSGRPPSPPKAMLDLGLAERLALFKAENGWMMGGTKKLAKWENRTRVGCNNCANRAVNVHSFAQLYLRGG